MTIFRCSATEWTVYSEEFTVHGQLYTPREAREQNSAYRLPVGWRFFYYKKR